jgi:8-oxo-dGTP pyrophosphatase MutT (NUDIX family)
MAFKPVDPTSPSELPRWQSIRRDPHADCRVFQVFKKRCRHSIRETERDFFEIASPDWVNVLALTPERNLVLVNQFRIGVEEFSWELPGGVVDRGEDPLAGGLRELAEETGFAGEAARIIGWTHPNPAIQNNRCHFVLVENCRLSKELDWDSDEEIECTLKPLTWALEAARSGKLSHALTLNALFFLQAELERAS